MQPLNYCAYVLTKADATVELLCVLYVLAYLRRSSLPLTCPNLGLVSGLPLLWVWVRVVWV